MATGAALAASGPAQQFAGRRAARLGVDALGGEAAGQRLLAVAQGRFEQGQVDEVALRVASAEAVGDTAQRAQQFHAARRGAFDEGEDRLAQRRADIAGEHGVVATLLHRPRLGGQQGLDRLAALGAGEGHHRVGVVEGVVAGGGEG